MPEQHGNPQTGYEGVDFGEFEFAYATNFVSTHTNREFFLTFACFSPGQENMENKKPRLRCVARVVIGPEHMMELITVLKKQFEVFQQQRRGEGEFGEPGFRR